MVCAMLNQTNKILRSLFIVFAGAIFTTSVHASGIETAFTTVNADWNHGNVTANKTLDRNKFVLDGTNCIAEQFSSTCSGTLENQGAVVMAIAQYFNDYGGCFIPTQIQFNYDNSVSLYRPDSFGTIVKNNADGSKTVQTMRHDRKYGECTWICKPGFKGRECLQTDDGSVCGKRDFNFLTKRGTMVRKWDRMQKVSANAFSTAISRSSVPKLNTLAIIEWYKHGVLVSEVSVIGAKNTNSEKTWITYVESGGKNSMYLLCDEGYKPNANQTDCEPMHPEKCDLPPTTMCQGWTETEYNNNKNNLEYVVVDGCTQYRCLNGGFISATNRTCASCGGGDILSGIIESTGVCKHCSNLGEYFDDSQPLGSECQSAYALTKPEMKYGKDKLQADTINTRDQCWTKLTPGDYRACIFKSDKDEAEAYDPVLENAKNIAGNSTLSVPNRIEMLREFKRDSDVKFNEAIDGIILNLQKTEK